MQTDSDDLDLFFRVDKNDKLVDFSSNWNSLVFDAKAPELKDSIIIGMSLYDFIDGDSTRMYIESIIQYARTLKEVVQRPYRCDTPAFKREMVMELIPFPNGDVVLRHKLLSQSPWHYNLKIARGNDEILNLDRCSICNDIRYKNRWIMQDDLVSLEPEFESKVLSIFYTVCPRCNKLF